MVKKTSSASVPSNQGPPASNTRLQRKLKATEPTQEPPSPAPNLSPATQVIQHQGSTVSSVASSQGFQQALSIDGSNQSSLGYVSNHNDTSVVNKTTHPSTGAPETIKKGPDPASFVSSQSTIPSHFSAQGTGQYHASSINSSPVRLKSPSDYYEHDNESIDDKIDGVEQGFQHEFSVLKSSIDQVVAILSPHFRANDFTTHANNNAIAQNLDLESDLSVSNSSHLTPKTVKSKVIQKGHYPKNSQAHAPTHPVPSKFFTPENMTTGAMTNDPLQIQPHNTAEMTQNNFSTCISREKSFEFTI